MALYCLFVLLITWITAIPCTDGRVETNIERGYQQCCTDCPNITNLIGQDYIKERYAIICQMGKKGKTSYYATLFDKWNKIPVFSKFVVRTEKLRRATSFLFEADLVCPIDGHLHNYSFILDKLNAKANNVKEVIQSTQASDYDYEHQSTKPKYQRGHLNPHASFCHSADAVQSTFTYTNVAPQVENFNLGTWSRVEETMRHYVNICPDHVAAVVGVTPSSNIPLNMRVNIPSFFWAYLQYSKYIVAILAPNQDNESIKERYLITQLYLPKGNLSLLLLALRNLSLSSRDNFEADINNFRQNMQPFALCPPEDDIFSEELTCLEADENIMKCVGNKQSE